MIRRAFALSVALAAVLAAASYVHGNAAPPRAQPPNPKDNNFVIELDPNATEARLIVPKKLAGGRAALDADSNDRLAADETRPVGHTVAAGTALALALSCGGLWLVRRNRGAGRGLVLLVAAGALLITGVAAFADIPSPFGRAKRPERIPAPPPGVQLFAGTVKIEVSDKVDVVKLILDPATHKKLLALQNGPAPIPPGAVAPPPNAPPKKPDPK